MLARVAFFLLAGFWLVMNVMLWRAEFGSHPDSASAVPAKLVWRKILNSPDSSSLAILRNGSRIGYCHWVSNVGEEWANTGEESLPEGMPAPLRSVSLRLEGSLIVPEWTNRLRFEGFILVETNHEWREMDLRVVARPLNLQIHGSVPRQAFSLVLDDGLVRRQLSWRFEELNNPAALLNQFVEQGSPDWAAGLGLIGEMPAISKAPWHPHLDAWEDTLVIGHVRTRVYRLETTLFAHYRVSILISRVGEILRVDLPGQITLVNDQLNFR